LGAYIIGVRGILKKVQKQSVAYRHNQFYIIRMRIEEMVTKYWSQITLLLLGIGYFVRSILDLVFKKREINHTLFQNRRLESVSHFYSLYAKTEQMWKGISIYEILNRKITPKEIDNIVFPSIDELQRTVLELEIYFDEKQYNHFEDILNNVQMINKRLSQLYWNDDENVTTINKANDFEFFRDKKLLENKPILKQISIILKESFK